MWVNYEQCCITCIFTVYNSVELENYIFIYNIRIGSQLKEFIMAQYDNLPDSPDDNEHCANPKCNKDLKYPKKLHIHHPNRRGHYVEGCGQLCAECYKKTYGSR